MATKEHNIESIFNKNSKILILGSFPSVKSREQGFFYGHPQNRFWVVISNVFGYPCPQTVEEKISFLLENNIAVWDVIAKCDIEGSADSTIKEVVPNDLTGILKECDIKEIFVNGKTAHTLYNKHILKKIGRQALCLPSTSPANAAWSVDKLTAKWSEMIKNA